MHHKLDGYKSDGVGVGCGLGESKKRKRKRKAAVAVNVKREFMASICLSGSSPFCTSKTLTTLSPSAANTTRWCSLAFRSTIYENRRKRTRKQVVCMAPEEEQLTRRSPIDFPIEWERPKPGRRPDIFPQFSPMKTPLPHPLPCDPPEEDEEEEDEEKKEEEEENPEKEEQDEPNVPNEPGKL